MKFLIIRNTFIRLKKVRRCCNRIAVLGVGSSDHCAKGWDISEHVMQEKRVGGRGREEGREEEDEDDDEEDEVRHGLDFNLGLWHEWEWTGSGSGNCGFRGDQSPYSSIQMAGVFIETRFGSRHFKSIPSCVRVRSNI